jgi:poly-gamma-glutamate capsule biosynthesis protein CapA/YwtB (metallophosphatase superfamily)
MTDLIDHALPRLDGAAALGRAGRRSLLAGVSLILLLSACAAVDPPGGTSHEASPEGPDEQVAAPDTGNGDEPGFEPEADSEVEQEAPVDDGPTGPAVTIAFGGDVMFEGMIEPQLAADPEGLLAPIAPVFAEADLTVVNLETTITDRGEPEPKGFTFRAPPTGLLAMQAAGVDVASLANNHGMDYGLIGLEDTLAAAEEANFPLIGAGRDLHEAFAPHIATIRGREIAVIGATQVMDTAFFDTWRATDDQPGLAFAKHEYEADLIDAVTAARERSDTVVVYLHWGTEGERCPSERQTGLAERLADAGADIVVGSHAHRLQGTGMLGDTLIDYGLGNFVFYSRQSPGIDTGVLMVTVEGQEILEYEWVPARLEEGIPHPLGGDEATAAIAAWEDLRSCADLSAS